MIDGINPIYATGYLKVDDFPYNFYFETSFVSCVLVKNKPNNWNTTYVTAFFFALSSLNQNSLDVWFFFFGALLPHSRFIWELAKTQNNPSEKLAPLKKWWGPKNRKQKGELNGNDTWTKWLGPHKWETKTPRENVASDESVSWKLVIFLFFFLR